MGAFLPALGAGTIRGLGATLRIEVVNAEAITARWAEGACAILAFWHGRQLMMPLAFRGRRANVLVSRHQDGDLIAKTMGYFGGTAIRGSTTRGGAAALFTLVRQARQGRDIVVTPDGPRGPAERVQPGVVELAKLTGLTIFPVTFSVSRAIRLSSWDRFLVPLPFARGLFLWGDPIRIEPDADVPALETHRQALEAALGQITTRADAQCGLS